MDPYEKQILSSSISLEMYKHKLASRIKEEYKKQDALIAEQGTLTKEQQKKFLDTINRILQVDIRPMVREKLATIPENEGIDDCVYSVIMDVIENIQKFMTVENT